MLDSSGWSLIHTWLDDAVKANNWALIEELLQLLLLCPVDIERLKSNSCPKIVKTMSKDSSHQEVRILALKLVDQWLRIVKGEAEVPPVEVAVTVEAEEVEEVMEVGSDDEVKVEPMDEEPAAQTQQSPVYKITIRDGDELLAQVETDPANIKVDEVELQVETSMEVVEEKAQDEVDEKGVPEVEKVEKMEEEKKSEKKSGHHRSSSKHSSHKSSSHKSSRSSRDKDDKRSDKHQRSRSKSRSDRDKEREKMKKEQADKDKSTLEKVQSQSQALAKMGKIPKKKSEDGKSEKKSPVVEAKDKKKAYSMSIEPKKSAVDTVGRPKTVKMFNSKFRSTGLEEEAKPPGPKAAVKKLEKAPLSLSLERKTNSRKLSPPRESLPVAEKKLKLALESPPQEEKKGAIKLIKAKRKLPRSEGARIEKVLTIVIWGGVELVKVNLTRLIENGFDLSVLNIIRFFHEFIFILNHF